MNILFERILELAYEFTRLTVLCAGTLLMLGIPLAVLFILPGNIVHYFTDYDIRWLYKVGEDIFIFIASILFGYSLTRIYHNTHTENTK